MSTSSSIRSAVHYALFSGLTIGLALQAPLSLAQTPAGTSTGTGNVETVIVTGSAIRRVEGETSLPVQVIDSAAIERTGASSVTDLMQRLPTVQGGTVEAASVGGSTFGFAGVSLHNVGENRTLVLLNGRRLALFGGQTLTGFAAAMDLNAIPVSAIDRVEILSDGASALYGSDAVAGVVNFITKDRSEDRGLSANYYAPDDGGRETGVSLSGGFGDYEQDGYNFFFTVAGEKRDELNAIDREFAQSAIVNFEYGGDRWTFFNGSPRGIPGNATTDAGDLVSPTLLNTNSCPPQHAPVGDACYYDYVPDIQIYPERKRKTATGAFNMRVGEAQNLYVDMLWSRTEQVSKTAPVPGELLIQAGTALFNTYLAPLTDGTGAPLFTADSVVPYRAADLGQRINEDQADFYQFAMGIEGQLSEWDYDFAVTQSESDVKGEIAGYPGALAFFNALSAGNINPFVGPGEQSEAALADLEAINYKGYWDGGTSRLRTAELRAGRTLFDLPNGNPVQFAAGLSYHTEKFQSKPSDFAQANLDDPVAGTPAAGGAHMGDQRFGDASATIPYGADRNTFGAFTEVRIQPIDALELTGSLRYDDYSDVGDTTNYKVSFKATPTQQWLIRGSYGTGFHAPTVPQLNASRQSYGVTASSYDCPAELAAIASSLGAVCRPSDTQYDVVASGNPDLEPEKSDQWSIGFVFEPSRAFSFGADYWWIGIEDAFGQIDEGEAFGNPTGYPNTWTTFTDIGTGTTYLALDQSNVNTGEERYSGVDFNVQGSVDVGFGTLRPQLIATYMIDSEAQLSATGPFFANVGNYSTELDEVAFRWVGRLLTSLDVGDWSHTVTLNYRSGYLDIETTVDGIDENGDFNGEVADVRLDVDDYLTVDLQSTWNALEWLDVSVGVLNVFDEDPPLSLTAANFQIGYDARYYDSRGRVLFGRATVKF
jgi:iron complex outermembrane receptor protein